jgi:hypothetical protein
MHSVGLPTPVRSLTLHFRLHRELVQCGDRVRLSSIYYDILFASRLLGRRTRVSLRGEHPVCKSAFLEKLLELLVSLACLKLLKLAGLRLVDSADVTDRAFNLRLELLFSYF